MSRNIDNILDFKIKINIPENFETNDQTGDENKTEFEDLNESLFHTDQQFLFEQIIFYLKNIQTTD